MPHKIISELEQLIPRFCRFSFDDVMAEQYLGELVAAASDERELRRPRTRSADHWEAEWLTLPSSERFLSTVNAVWDEPIMLDFADLEQSFGECRVIPDLAICGPEYFTFQIDDQPLVAILRVVAEPRSRSPRQLAVRRIALRRFPPDRAALTPSAAVRFVVIADFRATAALSDRVPLPSAVRNPEDLTELIVRLEPEIALNVPDCLGDARATTHIHFRLSDIRDFQLDNLLLPFPAAAALMKVRAELLRIGQRRSSVETLRELLEYPELPEKWRQQVVGGMTNLERLVAELPVLIDGALSKQCDALLSHPEFQAFQAAWLGLAYLVEHVDFSTGSRIDVFSAPPSRMADVMRRGFVRPERHHHAGPVPALVIAEDPTLFSDADRLKEWNVLSASARVPVFAGSPPQNRPGHDWATDADDAEFLAVVAERISLSGYTFEPRPRRFTYQPSAASATSQCWASGAWAVGAMAARSLAEQGHINFAAVSLDPPRRHPNSDTWINSPAPTPTVNGEGRQTTRLVYDPATHTIHVRNLRALGEHTSGGLGLDAKLVFAPIVHFIERWKHHHVHRRDFSALADAFHAAAHERFPDTDFEAEFHQEPTDRLVVRVQPRFAIRESMLRVELNFRWNEG